MSSSLFLSVTYIEFEVNFSGRPEEFVLAFMDLMVFHHFVRLLRVALIES